MSIPHKSCMAVVVLSILFPSLTQASVDMTKESAATTTLDPNFPYGNSPQGNVCVSQDYYATPETLLGSWAMVKAITMDQGNILPAFLTSGNAVYAVGTAAIGNALGLNNCSGGCNQLNGYCFALKFNDKPSPYQYMIFQSVNIGAADNSFDIYLAGGGSGAFPAPCQKFWGTEGSNINWANHIENSTCDQYFGDYTNVKPQYTISYGGATYDAKETLKNACAFASKEMTGFNSQNWSNISVVPVTCPQSLTQITGLAIPDTITTVGNKPILKLNALTDAAFASSGINISLTTQMQDCKTPSSGYCNNVPQSKPNYQASISANQTGPLLKSVSVPN